jgi:hypothetical protein
MSDELQEFQQWYESQCDGDWEHTYGVEIGTLDNPGWRLEVDLAETELESRAFVACDSAEGTGQWMTCKVEAGKFLGHGGPQMLGPILRTFLDWVREGQGEA